MSIVLLIVCTVLAGFYAGYIFGLRDVEKIKREYKKAAAGRVSNFESVRRTYVKFAMSPPEFNRPELILTSEAAFRLACLREELNELYEAYAERDLPKISDALVDLVVFALGTAVRHNLPWEQLFAEVMRANNEKQVGNPEKGRNEAGWQVDLVKPEGWQPPDIEKILTASGWKKEV